MRRLSSIFTRERGKLVDETLGLPQSSITVQVYASLLKHCGAHRTLRDGIRVHRHLLDSGHCSTNVYLHNLVVHMYGKCGNLELARKAFEGIPRKNTYSWNIIMGVYVHGGQSAEVIQLMKRMREVDVQADKFTFATALAACSATLALAEGREIHERIVRSRLESDTVLETALVDMYTKCGSLEEARKIFHGMKNKDVVCWTALIAACAQHGDPEEAVELYKEMVSQGLQPDSAAYTSALAACASLRDLGQGKAVHARILDSGSDIVDDMLLNAIINMYARCGALDDATALFLRERSKSINSWNVIIAAYGQHGHPDQVLELYRAMVLEGAHPDSITFTSILYACNHAGMQKQGPICFKAMQEDHGISALPQHYNCIIDLLGRAGRLDEAEELINSLHYRPDFVPWTSLLNACKIHRDSDRAKRISRQLSELFPDHAVTSPDQLFKSSNIGRLGDALEVKHGVQAGSVKKLPACSSIQVDGTVHEFAAGDTAHPQNQEIRAELEKVMVEMSEAGYLPDTTELVNVNAINKLRYHSEKMAIAFGLVTTQACQPLRIFNNLRVCSDCHTAIKYISKLRKREIILRDGSRFHSFKGGSCSCGDYW